MRANGSLRRFLLARRAQFERNPSTTRCKRVCRLLDESSPEGSSPLAVASLIADVICKRPRVAIAAGVVGGACLSSFAPSVLHKV